jgi:copper resistance protein B
MKTNDRNKKMKSQIKCVAVAVAMLGLAPAWAQGLSTVPDANMQNMPGMADSMPGMSDQHGGGNTPATNHDTGSMTPVQGGNPGSPGPRDPNAYSDGYTLASGPYALAGPRQLHFADERNFGALLFNRLERVHTSNGNSTAYDAQAWFGRDYDRLVIKAEGAVAQGKLQDARTELLWGHALSTYWNSQLGVRVDSGVAPNRNWLAFGVQGLAPYWFGIDATAYLGNQGRSALRLGAEYDLLITQKLILKPRAEINVYGKRDAARDIGSGLSDAVTGLRLRYEFTRQFAPYVGIEWAGKFGESANMARAAGAKSTETRWVAGVRTWF